jgi:hypothetical protein
LKERHVSTLERLSSERNPVSKFALSNGSTCTATLRDVQRGKAVKVYKGHENKRFCLFASFATLGGPEVEVEGNGGGSDAIMVNGGGGASGASGGGGGGGLPSTYVVGLCRLNQVDP